MVNTKAELNRYFDMIDRQVPIRISRSIHWLRKPTSFGARLVVASLLIIGGFSVFCQSWVFGCCPSGSC